MNPLDLKDDIVVFDLDGVLSRYDFEELGFKLIKEHEWVRANMQRDMYNFITKTSLFDELIREKNSMDMYVLSTAYTSFEQRNKINFLEREYGDIREDNIIFVARDEFKVGVLQELRDIYDLAGKCDKRIVLIEDTVGIMASIEDLKTDRIKCFLISDFV